jgi:hypothetical protein
VQVTIGLGMAASLLLGCSGGVLNIGSNDAGASSDRATTTESASEVCALLGMPDTLSAAVLRDSFNWTTYSPAELRSDLSGEWNVCALGGPGVRIRSFRFTADGHWTIRFDDGDGGESRSPVGSEAPLIPGYEAGAAGYEGTYVFQDKGPFSDGGPVSLVSASSTSSSWFRPTFTTVMGQRVMVMTFAAEFQGICVFVGHLISASPRSRSRPSVVVAR